MKVTDLITGKVTKQKVHFFFTKGAVFTDRPTVFVPTKPKSYTIPSPILLEFVFRFPELTPTIVFWRRKARYWVAHPVSITAD